MKSNEDILEAMWKVFCSEVDETAGRASVAWRLLNCRYRMMLIKGEILAEQVDEFRIAIEKYRALDDSVRCA